MFYSAYAFKGQRSACIGRTSENCKSLILQDKSNIFAPEAWLAFIQF